MKIVGLITEYNPFHNGHYHHIKQAKKLTGADYVIVVMSGNFVQRGEPAIFTKQLRTHLALSCGADLVLEIPVEYSCSSAYYFATGAIALLDSLGIVDSICFGSECGDINKLDYIAEILSQEPPLFKNILVQELKSGVSFPVARSTALKTYITTIDTSIELDNLFNMPNNLLAIEYLKAIKLLKSSIKPYTIKRYGAGYNDTDNISNLASATAIRNKLNSDTDISNLEHCFPEPAFDILQSDNNLHPLYVDDFSLLLGVELLKQSDYSNVFGINSDLSMRITNNSSCFTNFTNFSELLKTKNITLTAIKRGLMNILLQTYEDDIKNHTNKNWVHYIKPLGFHRSSQHLLKQISLNSSLPIISKLSAYRSVLQDNDIATQMLEHNLFVDNLYRLVAMNKYNCFIPNEMQNPLVVIQK